MSHEDAWAAGLFEGEGCFVLNEQRSGRPSFRIQLAMQDREPMARWAEWANNRVNEWRTAAGKMRYTCQLSGDHAIELVERMRPWLGSRRLARFDELRTVWEQRGPDPRLKVCEVTACGRTRPRSTAGYDRHRKRGEPSCRSCLDAKRDYNADRAG